MFLFCLVFAMSLFASAYMCFVVTCWERADLLALVCGCSTFIRCSTIPYESICGPIVTVMKHLSDTFN